MKWLYELPDESRREIIELQEKRALALQLAMGLCIDTKQPPMSKDAARRIVAKCNAKIEKIAKWAAFEMGRNSYGFEVDKGFYKAAQEKMLATMEMPLFVEGVA